MRTRSEFVAMHVSTPAHQQCHNRCLRQGVRFSSTGSRTPSIQSVRSCVDNLVGVGFVVLLWEDLVADPPLDEEEEIDPAQPKRGWWKKATWVVDSRHTVFPALDDVFRSQARRMASAAFVAIPSMKETRIDPQPSRLLFLRRLRLPLPLQPRSCRCGRPLDVLGTTAQRVQMQGFGVTVVGCLRTWPPVSAGKREDVSGPTWRSATWIWVPTTT